MKAFQRRVRSELHKRLTEMKAANPAAGAKRVSDKRRGHLEARAEVRRRRDLGLPAVAPPPPPEGGSGGDAAAAGDANAKRGRRFEDGCAAPPAAKRRRHADGGGDSDGGGADDDRAADAFPTDCVRFGERAVAPPEKLGVPRKSKVCVCM